MTALLQVQWDVTGANLAKMKIPAGITLALYTTGSNGVPATPSQLAEHPDCVHIDQSPVNTLLDELADVIDMEAGAATLADLPGWYRSAKANYDQAKRPGQRHPATYASAEKITAIKSTYTDAGIASGPRLWIAHWDLPVEDAIDLLVDSGGSFPVIGVQLHNAGDHDVSLMSKTWLDNVSKAPVPKPPAPEYLDAAAPAAFRRLTSNDGGKTWH